MESIEAKIADLLQDKAIEALNNNKLDERKTLWLVLYALWHRNKALEEEIDVLRQAVERLYETAEAFAQLRRILGDCYDRTIVTSKEGSKARKTLEKIVETLARQ